MFALVLAIASLQYEETQSDDVDAAIDKFYKFVSLTDTVKYLSLIMDINRKRIDNDIQSKISEKMSLKLFAIWDNGKAYNNNASLKHMISSIKAAAGKLPPGEWVDALYNLSNGVKPADEYSDKIDFIEIDTLHDLRAMISGKWLTMLSSDELGKMNDKYHVIDPQYRSIITNGTLYTIVYSRIDGPGFILAVRSADQKILWSADLYGCGTQHAVGGLPRQIHLYCVVNSDKLALYGVGSSGSLFIEIFNSKTGRKLEAFATNNWNIR